MARALAMHVWCSHDSLSAPDHAMPMRISWGRSVRTLWTPRRQCAASWARCYNFAGTGTCTRDARMVFTRLVVCSGPRHADAGIVGAVRAHALDASTAVCGLVGEML